MTLKSKAAVFCTATLMGALAVLALPGTASATTLRLAPISAITQEAAEHMAVEKVDHRRYRKHKRRYRKHRRHNRRAHRRAHRRQFAYSRHRHGSRYRYRRGRHRHFHNGYFYAIPFWLGAAAIANSYNSYNAPEYYEERRPTRSSHVDWCLNRYRSYKVRTDTFRGYDGYDHRCVSPYSY